VKRKGGIHLRLPEIPLWSPYPSGEMVDVKKDFTTEFHGSTQKVSSCFFRIFPWGSVVKEVFSAAPFQGGVS